MPKFVEKRLPSIDAKLLVPLEMSVMLPAAACAVTIPSIEKLTLQLLEGLGLQGVETLLASEFSRVLGVRLQDIADLCRASRVREEDIETHAREIGVTCKLRAAMLDNVSRFVHFMSLAEKMQVVHFSGRLEGRTLLGHKSVHVLEADSWRALIAALVGVRYFRSKVSLYDSLLLFGFGQKRCAPSFEYPEGPVLKKSNDKKIRAVEYGRSFWYSANKLDGNLKRYTNGRTRMPTPLSSDALDALLAAAEQAASADKMRVSFLCS